MMLSTCQRLLIFKVLRTYGKALTYGYKLLRRSTKSFAYIWLQKVLLDKGNQYEFLKHPKIKWLEEGVEPPE